MEVTLLLRHLWFPHIRQEPVVRGAALGIVHSGFVEAKVTIYGVPDFGGISILLAIVLPPADGT